MTDAPRYLITWSPDWQHNAPFTHQGVIPTEYSDMLDVVKAGDVSDLYSVELLEDERCIDLTSEVIATIERDTPADPDARTDYLIKRGKEDRVAA